MNGIRFTLCVLLIGLGTIAQAQFPMGGSKGPTIKGKIEGKIIDSYSECGRICNNIFEEKR
ncbi:MAG: hypothetical protein IPN46_01240 [Saprospiraceae bacterium]|nr:hypothetical protein [Saprospiraceae bacterium]